MPDLAPVTAPESPCILVCTMDQRGEYCLGCHRTGAEIAQWSRASVAEKQAILALVAARQAAAE